MNCHQRSVQVNAIMVSLREMVEELDDGQIDSLEDLIVNHCDETGSNLFVTMITSQ
jgi:hypothetical protein